jgi:hypothetical protein
MAYCDAIRKLHECVCWVEISHECFSLWKCIICRETLFGEVTFKLVSSSYINGPGNTKGNLKGIKGNGNTWWKLLVFVLTEGQIGVETGSIVLPLKATPLRNSIIPIPTFCMHAVTYLLLATNPCNFPMDLGIPLYKISKFRPPTD